MAEILSHIVQLLLDAEQLVVLGDPVSAAGGAGLDLAGVGAHHDVGDGGILGLAGAVRDNGGVAMTVGQLDGVQGLGQGADLVDLDEDGVGNLLKYLTRNRFARP